MDEKLKELVEEYDADEETAGQAQELIEEGVEPEDAIDIAENF